jgi:hypothetical protein
VVGSWTRLHNEETRTAQQFWLENTKGRGHSEDLGGDRRIILEWILEK